MGFGVRAADGLEGEMTCNLRATASLGCACISLLGLTFGCTRTHYRVGADADAYSIVREKSAHTPWELPLDYDLHAPPHSRLHDPTPIDDPWLPVPAPQLYAYDFPPLQARQSQQLQPQEFPGMPTSSRRGYGAEPPSLSSEVEWVRFDRELAEARAVRKVAFQRLESGQPKLDHRPSRPKPRELTDVQPADQTMAQYGDEILVSPIPVEFWEAIPRSCLIRMLEFESVREEYLHAREYYREKHGDYPSTMPPTGEYVDPAARLMLEDIMDLTLLNSREYQTEKEILYNSALALSLQQFEYSIKPSAGANGTAANYDHTRAGGITTNRLGIPSSFQAEKMLVTGGDVLARFANSVVLTFNGPAGFAADIGSELLFDVSQSVLQRDIRLEALTQTERNVAYAARDFARFRKNLFRQQASRYYDLLNTYRQIEIGSQNYFAFIRSFDQREVEYKYGLASRFDADQLELSVLNGRNNLIRTCNALEGALDNLKIQIGLPTETSINLDMTELEQLTLRDELAVTGEAILRVRRRLLNERQSESPSPVLLLSYAIMLSDRILDAFDLQAQIGEQSPETEPMQVLRARLRVDAGQMIVDQRQAELDEQTGAANQDLVVTFFRTMRLTEELIRLTARQIEFAERLVDDLNQLDQLRSRINQLGRHADEVEQEFSARLENGTVLEQLPQMVQQATAVKEDSRQLTLDADQMLGDTDQPSTEEELVRRMNEQFEQLQLKSDELLEAIGSGLVPIEIKVDDAMMTALVLRFELVNQRGFMADDWRAIKLAADDLKSILNLRATQRINTARNRNRPFAFSLDDSETSLGVTFDTPFNRRAQRNSFRRSLSNYQASLRRLMKLEDDVKLAVRSDLRALALGKETYVISVASAALTRESVVSNDLQLQLGLSGVSVRDFRESQQAYTKALIDVAENHISYINDRTQLFFDLELLTVGDDGFWPELHDEEHQPSPHHQLSPYALPAYGKLPANVLHSHRIKRMNFVPPGISAVHGERRDDNESFGSEEIAPPEANSFE